MFTEGVHLRRLIRSLEDRHSMIPGRLRKLRLQTFLEKRKGFVFVFIKKDPCESERVLGAKIQYHMFYVHFFSFSSHFLISDLQSSLSLIAPSINDKRMRLQKMVPHAILMAIP